MGCDLGDGEDLGNARDREKRGGYIP
jgi:hypothetical protein